MNLRQLSQEIHAGNVAKGFYDQPFPVGRGLWLILTELAEATEAERIGKFSDVDAFEEMMNLSESHISINVQNQYFQQTFKGYVKDTFEDEVADAAIRTLDKVGALKLNGPLRLYTPHELKEAHDEIVDIDEPDNSTFFLKLGELISHINSGSEIVELTEWGLINVFSMLAYRAEKIWGFDLEWHIAQKMKYNALRPHKHGKKF